MMKKVERVWLKGTFWEVCQASSATANRYDSIHLLHGQTQPQSQLHHEKDTGYKGFKSIVKTHFLTGKAMPIF